MGIFDSGDDVDLHRLRGDVGDLDISDQPAISNGNKESCISSYPIEFRNDPGVAQANVSFVKIIGIQRGNKVGGENLIPVSLPES